MNLVWRGRTALSVFGCFRCHFTWSGRGDLCCVTEMEDGAHVQWSLWHLQIWTIRLYAHWSACRNSVNQWKMEAKPFSFGPMCNGVFPSDCFKLVLLDAGCNSTGCWKGQAGFRAWGGRAPPPVGLSIVLRRENMVGIYWELEVCFNEGFQMQRRCDGGGWWW